MSPNRNARSPLRIWQLAAFVAVGLLIGHSLSTAAPARTEPTRRPLEVRAPRICVALAVYQHSAKSEDYGYLATIANTLLKQYSAREVDHPDCGPGVSAELKNNFSARRWQLALDVVDAVSSGDYSVAPDACARADRIVPLDPAAPTSPSDAAAAARAQCVAYGLAFVGGDL